MTKLATSSIKVNTLRQVGRCYKLHIPMTTTPRPARNGINSTPAAKPLIKVPNFFAYMSATMPCSISHDLGLSTYHILHPGLLTYRILPPRVCNINQRGSFLFIKVKCVDSIHNSLDIHQRLIKEEKSSHFTCVMLIRHLFAYPISLPSYRSKKHVDMSTI